MTGSSLLAFWRAKLREFGPAHGGNMAITFAAFSLPVIMFTGWAIDYSRGNSAQTSMHAALDATGLTLSKEAQSLTQEQLDQKADKYFRANFNRPDATSIKVITAYKALDNGKYQLNLEASAKVPTTIAALWQDYMNIGADTKVIWGYKKLELALALDNTGSMSSSGKMTQLKIAAKNLVTILKAAAKKDGDIKISIVPFDTEVNIGTGYVNASWLDWTYWESTNGTCSKSSNTTQSTCTSKGGTWTPKNHNTWSGCVKDRTYSYDTTDDAPTSSATRFPVDNCGSLTSMLPLTSNWDSMNTKIDAMSPVGNTNVTIGLMWAWHALTPSLPLTEAAAPSIELDKAIILLTDGDNTESWKNSNNTKVTSQSSIDARTQLACTNIKASGVKIYTIRVINGNASLLKSCATTPAMYYDVQNASELSSVFTTIANSLANLRLAQ